MAKLLSITILSAFLLAACAASNPPVPSGVGGFEYENFGDPGPGAREGE